MENGLLSYTQKLLTAQPHLCSRYPRSLQWRVKRRGEELMSDYFCHHVAPRLVCDCPSTGRCSMQ